jgi:hypothetical protein
MRGSRRAATRRRGNDRLPPETECHWASRLAGHATEGPRRHWPAIQALNIGCGVARFSHCSRATGYGRIRCRYLGACGRCSADIDAPLGDRAAGTSTGGCEVTDDSEDIGDRGGGSVRSARGLGCPGPQCLSPLDARSGDRAGDGRIQLKCRCSHVISSVIGVARRPVTGPRSIGSGFRHINTIPDLAAFSVLTVISS